jgi:hypothetical protein
VTIGPDGLPRAVWWQGAWHPVAGIARRWRVRASWWTPDAEAWREYVKLTTTDGLLCVLAYDLRSGEWRLVRLYD